MSANSSDIKAIIDGIREIDKSRPSGTTIPMNAIDLMDLCRYIEELERVHTTPPPDAAVREAVSLVAETERDAILCSWSVSEFAKAAFVLRRAVQSPRLTGGGGDV